jgi:hypothetical protein
MALHISTLHKKVCGIKTENRKAEKKPSQRVATDDWGLQCQELMKHFLVMTMRS